jgi:hypothetical protein
MFVSLWCMMKSGNSGVEWGFDLLLFPWLANRQFRWAQYFFLMIRVECSIDYGYYLWNCAFLALLAYFPNTCSLLVVTSQRIQFISLLLDPYNNLFSCRYYFSFLVDCFYSLDWLRMRGKSNCQLRSDQIRTLTKNESPFTLLLPKQWRNLAYLKKGWEKRQESRVKIQSCGIKCNKRVKMNCVSSKSLN